MIDAVFPDVVALHAKAMNQFAEDRAKDSMNFVDVASGPEFPSTKVTSLEGHQSEVGLRSCSNEDESSWELQPRLPTETTIAV